MPALVLNAEWQNNRISLDWPRQVDQHNCGPLACAAAISILWGYKPCRATFGVNTDENMSSKRFIRLRHCLIYWFLDQAVA